MIQPTITQLRDDALLIRFGNTIDQQTNTHVRSLHDTLSKTEHLYITELVPAYTTLAVYYDPAHIKRETLTEAIHTYVTNIGTEKRDTETITIPACYEGPHAPDLDNLADYLGLSREEVIEKHSSTTYPIYMIGFLPGFPYLGGMDESLATPRKSTPRDRVPAGSIGIANNQTGIYPIESPGGWNIIARTPVQLFDPEAAQPFLLKAGQQIKFEPISLEEYNRYVEEASNHEDD